MAVETIYYLVFGLPEAAILTFYCCLPAPAGATTLVSPFFSSSAAAAASAAAMKPLGGGTGTSLLNGFAWLPNFCMLLESDDCEPIG